MRLLLCVVDVMSKNDHYLTNNDNGEGVDILSVYHMLSPVLTALHIFI